MHILEYESVLWVMWWCNNLLNHSRYCRSTSFSRDKKSSTSLIMCRLNQTWIWPHKTLARTLRQACATFVCFLQMKRDELLHLQYTHTAGRIAPSICAGFHGDRELKITWATALLYHSPTRLTQNVTRAYTNTENTPPPPLRMRQGRRYWWAITGRNRERWTLVFYSFSFTHTTLAPGVLQCYCTTRLHPTLLQWHSHSCTISSLSPTLTHFHPQTAAWQRTTLPESYVHITFLFHLEFEV